ncbi:unnamed protein product [Paramecium pentaurelia]|uniref:Uncharacterized protein n=1 Tax=Paramecium pentaurelia TaxID=43138 RepID=A0A8S1YAF1_9CILI|nr:unnamed protein product [Paramecium pentaurelia]
MNNQVHFSFKSFKVIDLLEDSLTYYSKRISLIYNIDKFSQIILNPKSITQLKKNQEQTLQILFSKKHKKEDLEFKINCYDPQIKKQISYEIKINLKSSKIMDIFGKTPAHRLIRYYKKSISQQAKQMDIVKVNQKSLKNLDIINFSLENQILCLKTAFICEVLNEKICKNQLRKSSSLNHNQNMYIKEMLQISQTIKKSVQAEKQDQLFGIKSLMQQLPLVRRIKMDSHEEEDTQKINYQDLLNISNNKQNINDSEELILSKKCLKMEEREVSNVLQSQKYFKRISKCYQIQNQLTACKQMVVSSQKHILKINQNQKIYIGQQWFPFYLKLFCQDSKSPWQLFNKAINYLQKKGVNYLLKKERAFQIMKNFLTMQKLEIQNQIIFQTNKLIKIILFY